MSMKGDFPEAIGAPGESASAICTYSGAYVDVFNPDPATIHLTDIAHALAVIPRFNGHTREHYTIAEHSIAVAELVPWEDGLWGLMHDASEAYMCDIPRPIKYHPSFKAVYEEIETALMAAVCDRFDLDHTMPESVVHADEQALSTERAHLMHPVTERWEITKKPRSHLFKHNDPERAFLSAYYAYARS